MTTYSWETIEDRHARQAAARAREAELKELSRALLERPVDGMSADEVARNREQLKAWNDELTTMRALRAHPGHGPMPGEHGGGYTARQAGPWGAAFVKARGGVKALEPSGSIVLPSLISETIIRDPQRPRNVLALVPFAPLVGTNAWSYWRETAYTSNAAVVASGARKPKSTYSVVREAGAAKVIAHISEPLARFDLEDAPSLTSYIDVVLQEGVELALEDEVVNGSGVAPHMTGILATPSIQTIDTLDTDAITTARRAVAKLQSAFIPLDGAAFVLSIEDWASIELTKASTSGMFLFPSPPVDSAARRLWGLPVVPSAAMADGTGLLVDFAGSTQGVEREGTRVDWSENLYDADLFGTGDGGSYFEGNMIAFRAEGRWDFVVTRARGVCTFATA